jgi:hypothetical protein
VYRFGLLEDFDHMYRYGALMDRVEGRDANALLQSYTDILPGRPTSIEHRHPSDELRRPYDRRGAAPVTKLNALTIMAGEHQTHDYYMTVGPMFSDPIARQLYAEIASIEEQHVTQYESIIDATETWLEKWLLHEATEIKRIWERFLDYELGHVRLVAELFEKTERRDAAEVLPDRFPEPIQYTSHRDFVRQVLRDEVRLSAVGAEFVDRDDETAETREYRRQLNSDGSPSDTASAGYVWTPGTELAKTRVPMGRARELRRAG